MLQDFSDLYKIAFSGRVTMCVSTLDQLLFDKKSPDQRSGLFDFPPFYNRPPKPPFPDYTAAYQPVPDPAGSWPSLPMSTEKQPTSPYSLNPPFGYLIFP